MVERCGQDPELAWLGEVITALASTGMRISELASLRWSDIDLEANVIKLVDESKRSPPWAQSTGNEERPQPLLPDQRRIADRAGQDRTGP
jgi:integrase